jgi:hypothetical protein
MGTLPKMSEDEIRNRQREQDDRQRELERGEADLRRRAEGIANEKERLAEERAAFIAQRDAAEESLARQRQENFNTEQVLARREAEAKVGFVEQQRLAFREVVETRDRQLDDARRELDEMAGQLLASAEARESACSERERGLLQREAEVVERHRLLESRAGELRTREEQVARAEEERDGGFTEARRRLDAEMLAGRRRAEEELGQERLQRLSDVEKELADERRRRREELALELEADREQLRAQRQTFEQERSRADAALTTSREIANQREADRVAKERDLDYRQKSLDAWEATLEARKLTLNEEVEQRVLHRQRALEAAEAGLEQRKQDQRDEVEEAVRERKASFAAKEETSRAEMTRLRGQLQTSDKLIALFEGLKKKLGGRDAELVLADLETQESALKDLKESLAQHSPGIRDELARLRAERDRLEATLEDRTDALEGLQRRMRGEDQLRLELQSEQDQRKWLTTQKGILDDRCNLLTAEIKRAHSAYEREEEQGARIRDIEKPDVTEIARMPLDTEIDEIEWLDKIGKDCVAYGLRFHPRILRAFHTALKTAEWSPLTVLAGVSGTGKSELPRLYAHFGGMTFKSLPVQPNWDSQESMLGFFNSIENKFDAQPVLKLLARSQKRWTDENHGLKDSLVMILLDEMNLAHAELYFAEFLSKLELRRGTKRDIPALEVKLGAGLVYPVPMGRNVLWTGTMNQDETTKSLSDKVLDRSIVIHFPRPSSLERRRELRSLPPPTPLLPRKLWESWWVRKSEFSDDAIRPYKAIIESINEAMSRVGRALGHRVWQSVEYYMANYPDTLAAQKSKNQADLQQAMRTAFEDQLVQKVMPKLRGIDTRGRGKTDCLDKVRTVLADHRYNDIIDDFNLSCEVGYGQFIWQTVSFLQEPKTPAKLVQEPTPDGGDGLSPGDAPPAIFMPDDPDRGNKWSKLNQKKREKYLTPEGGTPR